MITSDQGIRNSDDNIYLEQHLWLNEGDQAEPYELNELEEEDVFDEDEDY